MSEPLAMVPVLVCRIAWMDFYKGLVGDKPVGGGAYVRKNGFGHEIFNFRRESDGKFRGYVQPPGTTRKPSTVPSQQINIAKLGASNDADRVHGVTVFWVATDPLQGETRVVGWYDDATVFRQWQPSTTRRRLQNGENAGFMIEAKEAHLISPSDDRVHRVPRATAMQTGIGQSNIWYPPAKLRAKLLAYRRRVGAGATPSPSISAASPRIRRTTDTEARLRVERAAMNAVIKWCEARELRWTDVSLRKVGWDIEAGEGKSALRIEVKGSSSQIGAALLELTPNEFQKMTLIENRCRYRLAVVSVQGSNTKLVMFAWSHDAGAWVGDRFALELQPVRSARVKIVHRSQPPTDRQRSHRATAARRGGR
jgi:Domain of unknown function (DUF3883)